MSVDVDSDTMFFTEELDDTPPELFEGLTFSINDHDRSSIVVRTYREEYFVVAKREEVEKLQSALLNYLNTGYFDQEG